MLVLLMWGLAQQFQTWSIISQILSVIQELMYSLEAILRKSFKVYFTTLIFPWKFNNYYKPHGEIYNFLLQEVTVIQRTNFKGP